MRLVRCVRKDPAPVARPEKKPLAFHAVPFGKVAWGEIRVTRKGAEVSLASHHEAAARGGLVTLPECDHPQPQAKTSGKRFKGIVKTITGSQAGIGKEGPQIV